MYKITRIRTIVVTLSVMLFMLYGNIWRSNAAKNIMQDEYSNQDSNIPIIPLVDSLGGPYEMCLSIGTISINAPALLGGQTGKWSNVSSSPSNFIGLFAPDDTASTIFTPVNDPNTQDKKVIYTIAWTVKENGKSDVVTKTTITVNPDTQFKDSVTGSYVVPREGATALLSATAIGKILRFEWKRNNIDINQLGDSDFLRRVTITDDLVKGTSTLKVFNTKESDGFDAGRNEYLYSVTIVGECGPPISKLFLLYPIGNIIIGKIVNDIENPTLYAADTGNNLIQRSTDGGITWQATTLNSSTFKLPVDGFSAPEAIGVNRGFDIFQEPFDPNSTNDDVLYVADTAKNRVLRSFDGGKNWLPFVTITKPTGIAISPYGKVTKEASFFAGVNIVLEDTTQADVFVSTAGAIFMYSEGDRTKVKTIATSPTVIDPQGLAIDRKGNLYVADKSRGILWYSPEQLRAITPIPTLLLTSGGTGISQVNRGEGVGVDELGNLYVADTGNSRVMMYPVALSGVKPINILAGKVMISAILPKQTQPQLGEVRNPKGVTIINTGDPDNPNRLLVVSDSDGRNIGGGISTTMQANDITNSFDPTNWNSIGLAGSAGAGYFSKPGKIR